MKPFEKGDRVVLRKDLLSHKLKDKICIIRTCYYHISTKEYVVSFEKSYQLYSAKFFQKYINRKDRIESLNL